VDGDEAAAPTSIRRTEVPFGPFLAASALGYLFLHEQVWTFIERTLLGG
jgi:prepilin signal peptidase PulO-like enzyme (type II secretory pathway)